MDANHAYVVGEEGAIIETVSSASTELEASAGTLTSTATRSQELTTMVAAASEEASTNVQSVASATEELSSSVNEISRQVQESARMAGEAVDQRHLIRLVPPLVWHKQSAVDLADALRQHRQLAHRRGDHQQR